MTGKIEKVGGTAIAQWIRLHLPSCCPGFESQAHHLRFYNKFVLHLSREKNENKQKEARFGPFFKIEKVIRDMV